MSIKLNRSKFTAEFKLEAIRLVEAGQSIPAVSSSLGISAKTLYNWVNANKQGKVITTSGNKPVVTPEQMELTRLRAENSRLRLECEILKKATAYFAKGLV